MRSRLSSILDSPFLRRISWHVRRVGAKIDRKFYLTIVVVLTVILSTAAGIVWLAETDREFEDLLRAFHWAGATVLGLGAPGMARGPVGFGVEWLLGLFGVTVVAVLTGALVGFVIDFLLKEGQGMGASGYKGHIVVCGWNGTARDLLAELATDDYQAQVVLLHNSERNPAGDGVYFISGNPTNENDLRRAGIDQAQSAIICPVDASDEADMTSILTVLAIETMAPQVRTVVEVNNPDHVPHFRRAQVDELIVTSKLASHLLARTAMYPGLSELVTDLVSGGEGSELYRVGLPATCVGLSFDDLSAKLRADHRATLLAVSRAGDLHSNPPVDFHVEAGDDLVVIAESLGDLMPLIEATD
jgi:voltage-gated potassium channel